MLCASIEACHRFGEMCTRRVLFKWPSDIIMRNYNGRSVVRIVRFQGVISNEISMRLSYL